MGNTHIFSGVRDRITQKQACIQKKRAMDVIDRLPRLECNYDVVKSQIQNFDILLYADMDPISRVIRAAETLTKGCGMFSHAGLAVRGDLLVSHYPNIDRNEIYVFESTLSGYWNDNIENIHRKTFFGAQIRPLRPQIQTPTRSIAWCPLKSTISAHMDPNRILDTIRRYDETGYNYHIIDLVTSVFPDNGCCESCRNRFGHAEEGLMFCSELVAACFRYLGIFHRHLKPNNVLPVDFLGTCKDVPCIVSGIATLRLANTNLYGDTRNNNYPLQNINQLKNNIYEQDQEQSQTDSDDRTEDICSDTDSL